MALLGAAVSIPLTVGMMAALHSKLDWWGQSLGGWPSIHFDGLTVAVGFGLGLASGLLAGLLPAWQFASRGPWQLLAAPLPGDRVWPRRLRSLLLAAQTGLAVLLLLLAIVFTAEGHWRTASPSLRYFDSASSVTFNLTQMCPGNRCSQSRLVAVIAGLSRALHRQGHDLIVTDSLPFASSPGPVQYQDLMTGPTPPNDPEP